MELVATGFAIANFISALVNIRIYSKMGDILSIYAAGFSVFIGYAVIIGIML